MTGTTTKRSRPRVLVGTCGFAEAKDTLFRDLGILEVQQTFYQPPRPATAARWRQRAPKHFVFTLKAWQLITHRASSPTYRRLTEKLADSQLAGAGDFKWNPVTRMAWRRTREIAETLDAAAIVFQTPRSFKPTAQNLRRLARFFDTIDRRGRYMVFEPRGDAWTDELIRGVIKELDLVHAVDPFLRKPVGRGLRYFRLHGWPAYHYHYRYTAADLKTLADILSRTAQSWVLFNNDSMAEDARRFLRLLRGACR